MAYALGDTVIVFGEGGTSQSEIPTLGKKPVSRSIDILGDVTKDSLREVLAFVDLLYVEASQAGLQEVSLSLSIEANGKFALPTLFEAGLSGKGSITLIFRNPSNA